MAVGITVDVIPMGPGESPEDAIDRIYGGGVRISGEESDEGWVASSTTIPDGDGPSWQPDPGWSDPIIDRLMPLHDWVREDEETCVYLWASDTRWQIELSRNEATLRRRRALEDLGRPTPSDAAILRVFADLPAVVHGPDYHWWMVIGEIDGEFDLLEPGRVGAYQEN